MNQPVHFTLLKQDKHTGARAGILHTPHGDVPTPVYMPVGTQAVVKGLTVPQIVDTGASMVLSNTYHLNLRPGPDIVERAGGLHRFMAYEGPMLTDSGGFQVFSLGDLRDISEDGVKFRSHLDGSKLMMRPEDSMRIQQQLGADVAMAFDVCTAYPATHARAEEDMHRTHRWAERCQKAHTRADQALFGIVQGGFEEDLRVESAKTLAAMDFPGYAIGGLSVGEPKPIMYRLLDITTPHLPTDKARYLMGVGTADCLVEGVARGIDMFDCVLATRIARNGTAMTRQGRLVLRNLPFADDFRAIDEDCDCYTCRHHSRAYLRHLIKAGEMTAATLISIHNIRTLVRLMEEMRQAILEDRFVAFREAFFATFDHEQAFNKEGS